MVVRNFNVNENDISKSQQKTNTIFEKSSIEKSKKPVQVTRDGKTFTQMREEGKKKEKPNNKKQFMFSSTSGKFSIVKDNSGNYYVEADEGSLVAGPFSTMANAKSKMEALEFRSTREEGKKKEEQTVEEKFKKLIEESKNQAFPYLIPFSKIETLFARNDIDEIENIVNDSGYNMKYVREKGQEYYKFSPKNEKTLEAKNQILDYQEDTEENTEFKDKTERQEQLDLMKPSSVSVFETTMRNGDVGVGVKLQGEIVKITKEEASRLIKQLQKVASIDPSLEEKELTRLHEEKIQSLQYGIKNLKANLDNEISRYKNELDVISSRYHEGISDSERKNLEYDSRKIESKLDGLIRAKELFNDGLKHLI